jgi:hypothetical protein
LTLKNPEALCRYGRKEVCRARENSLGADHPAKVLFRRAKLESDYGSQLHPAPVFVGAILPAWGRSM